MRTPYGLRSIKMSTGARKVEWYSALAIRSNRSPILIRYCPINNSATMQYACKTLMIAPWPTSESLKQDNRMTLKIKMTTRSLSQQNIRCTFRNRCSISLSLRCRCGLIRVLIGTKLGNTRRKSWRILSISLRALRALNRRSPIWRLTRSLSRLGRSRSPSLNRWIR